MLESFKAAGKRVGLVTSAVAAVLVTGLFLAGSANATPPPDPVTDGFTDAGVKVGVYGGAMIALILIGLLIALGVKYLRRGVRSA